MQALSALFLLFFLSSCGKFFIPRKKIIWSDRDQSSTLFCPMDLKLINLHNQFLKLQLEVKSFVPLNKIKGNFIFSSFSLDKGPLDPLFISESLLYKNLEKMKLELEKAKGLNDLETINFLMIKLQEEVENWGQYLIRYNNTLCQQDFFLSKQQLDVRPYYQVQNVLTEHCSLKYECLLNELQKIENDDLKRAFDQVCHAVLENKQCQKNILEIESIMGQYKKLRIDPFYSLRALSPKFDCTEKVMNISLYSSEIILSEKLLKKVESFWNVHSDLNIILENSAEKKGDSLEIKLTENGISYVEDQDPKTIYLSKNLIGRKGMLEMTLAHELGHSLGLPDCYVEFLDHNLTSVYYHLDPLDLMCSLGPMSKISKNSLSKVFESRCR